MRVCYADPPYIGQARAHYKDDPSGIAAREVDHMALIAQLESEYDGYALSCSAASLPQIMTLLAPYWDGKRHRVLAWVKPFCAWKSTNPAYTWEPIIIKQPRTSNTPRVRDYMAASIEMRRVTHGAKPAAFCSWLFEAMNLLAGDELEDKFPGSGAVTRAWERWRRTAPTSLKRRASRKGLKQLRLMEAAS